MLRYTIESIIYIILFAIIPQDIIAKSTPPQNRVWPTTWYLGIDLAKTCISWYQKTGHVYEINGGIDFNYIIFDIDYGLGQIQRDSRPHNGSFTSTKGQYFRIGLSYNFLTPTSDHNQFFIGFRYAKSFFDFQIQSNKLQCNHPSNKDCTTQVCITPITFQNNKEASIAHWWEVVAGGKVYLISMLSIGCTARYKFRKKIENNLYVLPFDIPGFGLAEFDHAFGYSLYVLLRIPLHKNK